MTNIYKEKGKQTAKNFVGCQQISVPNYRLANLKSKPKSSRKSNEMQFSCQTQSQNQLTDFSSLR